MRNGPGSTFWVPGSKFRVPGSKFRVSSSKFRVPDFGTLHMAPGTLTLCKFLKIFNN